MRGTFVLGVIGSCGQYDICHLQFGSLTFYAVLEATFDV